MQSLLITPLQLQQLMSSGHPMRVLDCSFDLSDPHAGHQQFLDQHVAGALHVDLDRHLSTHKGTEAASGGRHPLPTRETFAETLGVMGIELAPDLQIVVYDRQGANYCGRLWWMLKWCGHEAVAVLDGGLAAWKAAGGAVESGPSEHEPPKASLRLSAGAAPGSALAATVTALDIVGQLGRPGLTLLDARANARFRGEIEPLDPVAGHIPGALNRPFTDNLQPDGRFKPATQLRAEFDLLLAGRDPASVVHHCGSGVSAIPNLLAMEIAGLGRTRLFPGSWSEWCNTPGLPIAQG
jgi:thiosulfate/3-mercaptopyruvate sulfurtransferase